MKRRIVSLIIAVAVALCSGSAFAAWQDRAVTDWYSDDGGTEDAPFVISTGEQLAGMAKIIKDKTAGSFTGQKTQFDGQYFVLTNDIDLADEEWLPIGWFLNDTTNYTFAGDFDGCGHKVTGLKVTQINAAGPDFKSECPALFGGTANAGKIRNLYVEGYAGGNKAKGASMIVTWSRGEITNCVASGDIIAEGGNGQEYSGVATSVAAGPISNVVAYGTSLTKHAQTLPVMHSAGGIAGYRYTKFGVGSMKNSVSMVSSIKKAKADGSGAATATADSALFSYNGNPGTEFTKNCFYLTGGPDQPGPTEKVSFTIDQLNTIPAASVMLDSKALASTPPAGKDTVIPLELYPLGSNTDSITAEWKFDDADVTVKKVEKGYATVVSATEGEKKFSVVVKGLNGFGADDSVTLRGTMKFKEPEPEAPVVKDVEIVREDGETSTIENVDVTNIEKPADIAAIEGDDKPAEETTKLFATTMNDGSAILSVSKVSVVTSFSMKFTYDDEKEPADLPVSITVSFTPDSALPIYIMAKGSDGYELFPATYSGGVVKAIIENFRSLIVGGKSLKAAADEATLELSVIQADVVTKEDTGSSSGGACSAGTALFAVAALAALLRKRR